MISLSFTVKSDRGYNIDDTEIMTRTLRIDFFRDDRARMAIYYALNPDMSIVQYPGETFLSDIASIKPLDVVVSAIGLHPKSYQTHFTCALEGVKYTDNVNVDRYSWMTVTFISEFISNMGLLIAFFFVPFFVVWFSKKIDRNPFPYNFLLSALFILLNLFDFIYISLFAELLVIALWLSNRKIKKQYAK